MVRKEPHLRLRALVRDRPQVFLGWWMVALAGFMASINGTAYNKGYVLLLIPVGKSLGTSRAAISLVFSLSRSEGGPIGPIAGWLIDRFGPKLLLFIGTIIAGSGWFLLSRTDSIWTFGLVYLTMITVGSDIAFNNGLSALVNNWFIRRRGLAMSTYLSMLSLGPAMLVPLLGLLIATEGWRTAAVVSGGTILTVVLPLGVLVRNTPESVGLSPDGRPPPDGQPPKDGAGTTTSGPSQAGSAANRADFGVGEALTTPTYWLMMVGTSCRLTAKSGVMLHIIPILVWKGVEEQTAAYIFGLILFLQVPFFLVAGWLADTFPKNLVLFAASLCGTAAFLALASPASSVWIVALFVFLFAVTETNGANNWVTLGDYFGRRAYGRLRGITHFMTSPGIFIAPVFAGWWYDRSESYALPLWVFTAIFAVSAISFGAMRKPARAP